MSHSEIRMHIAARVGAQSVLIGEFAVSTSSRVLMARFGFGGSAISCGAAHADCGGRIACHAATAAR